MKKGLITLLACTASAVIMAAPSMALPFFGNGTPDDSTTAKDNGAGAKLATAILADIGDRASTASSADLEGFMVYVISQGDYTPDVIGQALDQVGAGATGNLKAAVDNVRLALLKKKLNRGTAAILGGNGGSYGGGGSGFSAPGVSVGGGGGSNYTS